MKNNNEHEVDTQQVAGTNGSIPTTHLNLTPETANANGQNSDHSRTHNSAKIAIEHQLVGNLLRHPGLSPSICRGVSALHTPHFEDPDAKQVFSVISTLVDSGTMPTVDSVARELNKWADDPLNFRHRDEILAAANALPNLVAACSDTMNNSKAAKLTRTLAKALRDWLGQGEGIPLDEILQTAPADHLKNLKNPSAGISLGSLGSSPKDFKNFQVTPQPVTQKLRPVPKLPAQMLPKPLRDWMIDIAERMGCSLEYVVVAALIALSCLVGRKIGIRPKRYDDWTVVPNLWGASVGSPSKHKTPAASAAMAPLQRLVAEANTAYKAALEAFELQQRAVEAQSKAGKTALERAAKAGMSTEDLINLAQQSVPDCTPPTLKRYIVNDPTIEALGEILEKNPNGVLLFRDELMGFISNMEKQGHESDRDFYKEAFNGTLENYAYDRVGRGTHILPAVCVSVFGSIQPDPLADLVRAAAKGKGADGFIARFQLMVYPDPVQQRGIDRSPDKDAKNGAYEVFKKFDQLDLIGIKAETQEGHSIPFLRFNPEAQELFNEWLTHLETEKLPAASERPLIESHLAKYRSLMPSLALLFHLIDVVGGSPTGRVSLQAAKMAEAWCGFLEQHALRIYQIAYEVELEPALALADHIRDGSIKRLQHYDGARFKIGDVVQKGWAYLSTTEDVNRAVAFLEDRHWLQVVELPAEGAVGRPQRWVYIHPELAKELAESDKGGSEKGSEEA